MSASNIEMIAMSAAPKAAANIDKAAKAALTDYNQALSLSILP